MAHQQLESMLAKAQPAFTNECCIYKVPSEIRESNPAAYTPKVISIGPFHYESKELQNMEGHKQMYCRKFTERSQVSFDNLVNCVQNLEPNIRHSYSKKIDLSADNLVIMTMVDCGFIIELFLRSSSSFRPSIEDDVILSRSWLTKSISMDLLLLENQLPFFVFEELYNLAFGSSSNNNNYPSFIDLTLHYFSLRGFIGEDFNLCGTGSITHFIDLLRICHLQPYERRLQREAKLPSHFYSATELRNAGVMLRAEKSKKRCILELQFSDRILNIPVFKVEDKTEILLRNMVALEQCHYHSETYITDYVQILKFLMNTDKDVDVLVEKGIIVNWLGDSNEVIKLFNGLCRNTLMTGLNTDYLGMCEEMNAYCENDFQKYVATLRRDYFNKIDLITFLLSAYALVFTIIQTVCSIMQVKAM